MIIKDLGAVSAYAYAVEKGYTGTEEEFAALMASYASVAEEAAESAESAQASAATASSAASTATTKASEASTAAQTATAKAEEAQADADAAALDASQALSAASTATTKASEAAQSASDATTAKTAAQTAQTAAEGSATTAQTAAQTATTKAAEAAQSARTLTIDTTLTQSGQAADSKVVGDKFPIIPLNTTFFKNFNYGIPENVKFYDNKFAGTDGVINASTNTCSLVVKVEPNTEYYVKIPLNNRQLVVESADNSFTVGNTYTRLTVNNPYSGTICFTTGASANYVLIYFYSGAYDYEANKNSIIITKDDLLPDIHPTIIKDYLPEQEIEISPKDTTFFDAVNYFDHGTARVYTDRFVNASGGVASNTNVYSVSFPVVPNTTYWFYAPNMNRAYAVENDSDKFPTGTTFETVCAAATTSPISFTTGSSAKYVLMYFHSGVYNYEANKDSIVLNKGVYYGKDAIPYIPYKHLPSDLSSPISGANILIFGDSITTCCNITVDANHQTSAYVWRNPSNSYVDGEGNTIGYSMWPKILKESESCGEIRNYAESGASYKTRTREVGYERQNLHYQIDIALNDLDNPNGVFEVDDYVPDIVIFALGTNDGAPDDTYESAMAKTVLKSDNASIDVDATLLALDETKFCESARKAFLRIKQAFPMAQLYCSLPIQRANNEVNFNSMHDVLEKIAERYGCIIIDGTANSGIIREFNNLDSLGAYLKDGLHPNEKGQNLMARMIIKAIKSHYMPFGIGFN